MTSVLKVSKIQDPTNSNTALAPLRGSDREQKVQKEKKKIGSPYSDAKKE